MLRRLTILIMICIALLPHGLRAQENKVPDGLPTTERWVFEAPAQEDQHIVRITDVSFTRDSVAIAIQYRRQGDEYFTHIMSLETGELLAEADGYVNVDYPLAWRQSGTSGFAWTNDGSQVALHNDMGQVEVWRPRTNEQRYVIQESGALSWSVDGQFLAIDNNSGIHLVDGATGEEFAFILRDNLNGMAWHPHESIFAAQDNTRDNAVAYGIVEAETGERLQSLPIPDHPLVVAAFDNPKWRYDGQQIIGEVHYAAIGGGPKVPSILWDLQSGEVIFDRLFQLYLADWHPHQSWITSVDPDADKLAIIDTQTGEFLFTRTYEHISGTRWSPDGQWLAIWDGNEMVHVWGLADE